MNIGVGLPNTLGNLSRDLLITWAKQADAGPFSSLAVFDRLVYGSYEPLTTLAKANGARVILDDSSYPEYSYSTITFRKAMIDEHPEAVRTFLAAIEEAVALINASPEKYEDLLVERKVVPPTLKGKFNVPPFVTAGVPSEAQWDDMINWAIEKGLLEQKPQYIDSVNGDLLPK